ncbi:MAG: cell envelope integrity protein CreD [Bacteroidales bacterium]|nr:cell envelope integrity protein CreD [Bacteroidales bacterium]
MNPISSWKPYVLKFSIITGLALLMLIPLSLIRKQVNERSNYYSQTIEDIQNNWGGCLEFIGPKISLRGNDWYPDHLKYSVHTTTTHLHRSIYDVSAYTADIMIEGQFVIADSYQLDNYTNGLILWMGELKGIQGTPSFTLNGKTLMVHSGDEGLQADFSLNKGAKVGDVLPFTITMMFKGSESISFAPIGNLTEVEMISDYPDPSFFGDFLPSEREINANGFSAQWMTSQISLKYPAMSRFGVRLTKPVTQYQQTERASKYGLLIIFLVFIAGVIVEIISKKSLHIIQYIVIAASLVLFYSLLLAFADFLPFGWAYLIASVMTTAALGGYFIGIIRNKWAWLLTGLVVLAYGTIYILLQMESFSFLTGTMVLFLILCIIMALTRNISNSPGPETSHSVEGPM